MKKLSQIKDLLLPGLLVSDTPTSFFGLVPLKGEGAPMHPDEFENQDEISDAQYLRQLQAYKDHYKLTADDLAGIARDRLLEDLK